MEADWGQRPDPCASACIRRVLQNALCQNFTGERSRSWSSTVVSRRNPPDSGAGAGLSPVRFGRASRIAGDISETPRVGAGGFRLVLPGWAIVWIGAPIGVRGIVQARSRELAQPH